MSDARHLVLCGFMGAGKTSVGKALARQLGRPFVDTDKMISDAIGLPIPQIFKKLGEEGFRQAEAETCELLAGSRDKPLVIAVGGGAVVSESNREMLRKAGHILVCLDASPDTLWKRLQQGNEERPLLGSGDEEARRAKLEELLEKRKPAYDAIAVHVRTDDADIATVGQRVLEALGLPSIRWVEISARDRYPVSVGNRQLTQLGKRIKELTDLDAKHVVVVTDENVAEHWLDAAIEALEHTDYKVDSLTMAPGEENKTLETVTELAEQLVDLGADRTTAIVALGGGVVGDVAGFLASIFMRGVPLIQVPSSLLSMVDSSVGGKTGVDFAGGKNLLGTFKQPLAVIADPDLLNTLDDEDFRNGTAEVVKHGVISGGALWAALKGRALAPDDPELARRIGRAVQAKIDVVEQDVFERGQRALLNLGHTFGHALESVTNYEMPHGICVSIGMVAAARYAELTGRAKAGVRKEIEEVLEAHNLPLVAEGLDVPTDDIVAAMSSDKKRKKGKLRLIVPEAIGHCAIVEDIDEEALRKAVKKMKG